MNKVYYPGGKSRDLVNSLAYVHRATAGSYPSPYLTHLIVARVIEHGQHDQQYAGARVLYCLSDGRVVTGRWASYSVLMDYFTRRSTKFKGTPIITI